MTPSIVGFTDGTDSGKGTMREYYEEHGMPLAKILEDYLCHATAIREAITRTMNVVSTSRKTRKTPGQINIQGVKIVEAARFVWEKYTGKHPPSKDLNAASKFGNFLGDLFYAYEVEVLPKSAYRAWLRLNG